MYLDDFDYHLPPDLIAQEPLIDRASSRMMTVDRKNLSVNDSSFKTFPDLLNEGDLLVMNNTRVFPARLHGNTPTGAAIEIFLIRETGDGKWKALARPGKRLKPGKIITFSPDLSAEVLEKEDDGVISIKFDASGDLFEILEKIGSTPLPPYIKRDSKAADPASSADRERYQTVFASQRGAIAAPTAGLHFTPELLRQIALKGVEIAEITLHVGYGTFEPVRVEDVSQHAVSPERFSISPDTAARLNAAKSSGRRIAAVGTTTTRSLESAIDENGKFRHGDGIAGLTILPGYEFKAVDALLTNFHLPKSSLLILVSTFGGHRLIMDAYEHAVSMRYRFFSYGDCMFIT